MHCKFVYVLFSGPAHLLPAGGFTVLRLAHIPNTPASQIITDSLVLVADLMYVFGRTSIIAIKCRYVPRGFVLSCKIC